MDEQEKEWERDIQESMAKPVGIICVEVRVCRDCGVLTSKAICPCCGCKEFKTVGREIEPDECAFCGRDHWNNGKHLCMNCEEQHEPDSLEKIYELLDENEYQKSRLDTAELEGRKLKNRNKQLELRVELIAEERDRFAKEIKFLTFEHTKRLNEVEGLIKEGKQLQGKLAEIEVTQKAIDEGFRKFKIGKMVELELLRDSNGILILDHTKLLEEIKELKNELTKVVAEKDALSETAYELLEKNNSLRKERNDLKRELIKLHTKMEHERLREERLTVQPDPQGY